MSGDEQSINWTTGGSAAETYYCFKDMQSNDDGCVKGKTNLVPVGFNSGEFEIDIMYY